MTISTTSPGKLLSFARHLLAIGAWVILGTTGATAQSLDGTWNFAGHNLEVQGGLATNREFKNESGTVTFTPLGNDQYRVVIIDGETQTVNLTLVRSGNRYTGERPPENQEGQVETSRVEITLLDENTAMMLVANKQVSIAAGLNGQVFSFGSTVWVLTRGSRPVQQAALWPGSYEVARSQLGMQIFVDGFESAPGALPLTVDAAGGFSVRFPPSSRQVALTDRGSNLDGVAVTTASGAAASNGSVAINRWRVENFVSLWQVDAERMVVFDFRAEIGTVNTGTSDQYFVLAAGQSAVGLARRVPTAAPVVTRPPVDVAVLSGGDAFFSVTATGAPTPSFEWAVVGAGGAGKTVIAQDNPAFAGQGTPTLIVRNVTPAQDGLRVAVTVSNTEGTTVIEPNALRVLPEPTGRLPNLSVRTSLGGGQNLIVGFAMRGGSKQLLVRAVGPQLAEFNVPGAMPDPRIGFFNTGGVEIASNVDWNASTGALFGGVGAFPLVVGSKDAALSVNLEGSSTAIVNGPAGGVVLVEVYDVGDNNDTRLANVSARNQVGTGADILIAGFVVRGADPKNMLIRAVGPTLAKFGVPGVLADPKLEIFNAEGERIAENDNWNPSVAAAFGTTGAFGLPEFSLDAALLLTLPPGAYTAQVSGVDGATGEALVEIYELP